MKDSKWSKWDNKRRQYKQKLHQTTVISATSLRSQLLCSFGAIKHVLCIVSLPGSHWLCCSACWGSWKVLILSPHSEPSHRLLRLRERVEQTSPSGCSKTPWSYWTTWWAERWCSERTEAKGDKKVSETNKIPVV